ncbi:bifunctional metallophosphatase/5'-nucleotidase, partial [bacterium]|nr:bifunctional metallophosphatase/5'-nucleotidase [bacterium]
MDLISDNKSNQNTQVHVIFYTDVHGRFLSEKTSETSKQSAGIDRLSTYAKQVRKRNKNVLIIDNGDSIQGTPLVDLHDFTAPSLKTLNHPLNIVHDKIGVNCFIVGNHEFNFGMKQIDSIRKKSRVAWLGANVYSRQSDKCYFEPYRIFDYVSIRIGVLGLVTEYVSRWESGAHISGLEFKNAVETCGALINKIREECDFLIVAYHGGLKRNPENNERWAVVDNNENQGLELWNLYPEIDLLLTGHQHRSLLFEPDGDKAIVIQASCYGKQWAHIVVEKKDKPVLNQKLLIHSELIDALRYESDPEIRVSMAPHLEHCENILNTILGTVDESFLINDPMNDVWLKKHPLIQWINDLMCKITGVDISGIPLLDANLKGFSGEVKIREILENFIFQDNVCILEINGIILR